MQKSSELKAPWTPPSESGPMSKNQSMIAIPFWLLCVTCLQTFWPQYSPIALRHIGTHWLWMLPKLRCSSLRSVMIGDQLRYRLLDYGPGYIFLSCKELMKLKPLTVIGSVWWKHILKRCRGGWDSLVPALCRSQLHHLRPTSTNHNLIPLYNHQDVSNSSNWDLSIMIWMHGRGSWAFPRWFMYASRAMNPFDHRPRECGKTVDQV